ncbi:MAG: sigma 54-interacting transcriptional regulator [Candidatus Cloacimonetes bacterium]|nr:sigma 54-interacting transcriptional regulator [Candidatus Cloacimonadota bacterium]
MESNTLITWIGFNDLENKIDLNKKKKPPIETILTHDRFKINQVVVIFDEQRFKEEWYYQNIEAFIDDLKKVFPYKRIILKRIDEIRASDSEVVFEESHKILRQLKSEKQIDNCNLFFNTGSGTNAMLISWLYIKLFTEFDGLLVQSYYNKKKELSISEPLNLPEKSILNGKTDIENRRIKEKQSRKDLHIDIVGEDPNFLRVVDQAQILSKYESLNVLIVGESGTGKEEIAKIVYGGSKNKTRKMQAVNIAAIPETTIEAQLFGYKKGSFTGADKDYEGIIMSANKSVLFLDEIGDLPLSSQPKLLRVIQEKKIRQIGGEDKDVDVRFISATNCPEKLREDLFYRLAEAVIEIPPLRDRKKDIPILTNHFLNKFNDVFLKENPSYIPKTLHPELSEQLMEYTWEGNVRELMTVLKSACVFTDKREIAINDIKKYIYRNYKRHDLSTLYIPFNTDIDIAFVNSSKPIALKDEVEKFKSSLINSAKQLKGKQKDAATFLGISEQSLSNYLTKDISNNKK